MSKVSVKFGGRLFLLVIIFLYISHPASVTFRSGGPEVSANRPERAMAISDIWAQTTARDAPGGVSKKSTFIMTDVEPLLLLLFGLLLFSVATGIKLKLLKR